MAMVLVVLFMRTHPGEQSFSCDASTQRGYIFFIKFNLVSTDCPPYPFLFHISIFSFVLIIFLRAHNFDIATMLKKYSI